MFLITPMVLLLIALAGGGAAVASKGAEEDREATEIVETVDAEQAPESHAAAADPGRHAEP